MPGPACSSAIRSDINVLPVPQARLVVSSRDVSCDFEVRIGERIGVLLREDRGVAKRTLQPTRRRCPAAGCGTVAYADLGRSRRGGVGRARAGPRDLLSDDQRPDYDGHRYFHCPGGNDDEHSTATLGRPLRGIGRRRSRRSRRQCPGAVAGRGLTGASRSWRTRMAFANPLTKKIGMTCGIQVASHRPD